MDKLGPADNVRRTMENIRPIVSRVQFEPSLKERLRSRPVAPIELALQRWPPPVQREVFRKLPEETKEELAVEMRLDAPHRHVSPVRTGVHVVERRAAV